MFPLCLFVHFHPSYPLPVVCTCGDILESYITRGWGQDLGILFSNAGVERGLSGGLKGGG